MVDDRPGFLRARVSGKGAASAFASEPGGHRYQRVPPNEKRGRVHTSTVTVAVFEEDDVPELELRGADLDETFCRGSGRGGQHRNKTDTVVMLEHRPTGTRVRVDGGRSQDTNRATARARLRERLAAEAQARHSEGRRRQRKAQVGTGMRGDKVRTISFPRDEVVNHRNGKRVRLRLYLRGQLSRLL